MRSDVMESWVNEPIDNLISTWGPPDQSVTLSDGKQVLTWIKVFRPATTCRQTFITNVEGKIEKWSLTDCPDDERGYENFQSLINPNTKK